MQVVREALLAEAMPARQLHGIDTTVLFEANVAKVHVLLLLPPRHAQLSEEGRRIAPGRHAGYGKQRAGKARQYHTKGKNHETLLVSTCCFMAAVKRGRPDVRQGRICCLVDVHT